MGGGAALLKLAAAHQPAAGLGQQHDAARPGTTAEIASASARLPSSRSAWLVQPAPAGLPAVRGLNEIDDRGNVG